MKQNKLYRLFKVVSQTINTLILIAIFFIFVILLTNQNKQNKNDNDRLHKNTTNESYTDTTK